MCKKVCITGVYGLLGQNLVKVFSSAGYDISGIDLLSEPQPQEGLKEYFIADITDEKTIAPLLKSINPDVFINTAALTNVDLCETERAKAEALNGLAVGYMAAALPSSCRFVQISTDYVFDGVAGPYNDDSPVNPISWYGATKLMGEEAVRNCRKDGLIIRTMVLIGRIKGLKPDFIHFIKSSLESGKAIKIVTDQVGNVTLASNLAANIKCAVELGITGTMAVAGSERISRYDFALKVAERYNLDKYLISPILTADLKQPAKRPLSSGFTFNRAKEFREIKLLTVDQMMTEYDNE
ncbi:MAG: SDR family oxidoreductase [Fibrobacteres bacterium]|nr:SDR family oxidoreductase [Fibrobacterota bacterium]